MKYTKRLLLVLCALLAVSCEIARDSDGATAKIEGTLVKISDTEYGIDGVASPYGYLFYTHKKVKHKLAPISAEYLVKWKKPGDSVSFIYQVGSIQDPERDWGLTIGVYSM